MDVRALHRRHPVPVLTTVALLVAFGATVTYYAGIVPGVPKTLPVFVRLVAITTVLLAVTVVVWFVTLLE